MARPAPRPPGRGPTWRHTAGPRPSTSSAAPRGPTPGTCRRTGGRRSPSRVRGPPSRAAWCAARRTPRRSAAPLVAEWLNVSSGADAAPDWTYLSDEIVRRGHVWVGISAQYVGVEGGSGTIGDLGLRPLKAEPRYASLSHPGDAYCYGIFTMVVDTITDWPLNDLDVTCRLAVGESQSAYALTTYANGVQPLTGLFDGFLIHSRGGATMPLGEPGGRSTSRTSATSTPTLVRDDLDVPVVIVQTETDLTGRLRYLPARQPDPPGCGCGRSRAPRTPTSSRSVSSRTSSAAPCPSTRASRRTSCAPRSGTWRRGRAAATRLPRPIGWRSSHGAVVPDETGNTRGGVRTPCVDAPTSILRGDTVPDAPGGLPAVRQHAAAGRSAVLRGLPCRPGRLTWRRTSGRPTPRSPRVSCSPRTGDAVLAEARPDLIPD